MKTKSLLILAAISMMAINFTRAQQLDNSFGSGGIVTTAIGLINDQCNSIVQQSDGKIVAAGYSVITNNIDSSHSVMAVIRYNTNGSLDNSFGTNGKVTTKIDSVSEGMSVALQNDGKIVVAGYSFDEYHYKFALARYNIDGSLDNSFGTNGKVTTDFDTISIAFVALIQPNGKIVLAGESWNGSDYDFALARYNTNGSLDNTFGSGGKITTALANDDEIYAMVLQNDGKIVVTGITGDQSNFDFALARYNSDGSMDNTFGTNGKVITDLGSPYDIPKAILLQNDGKIIVTGNVFEGIFGNSFALVRYNTNGSLDNTFGTNGVSVSLAITYDCISSASMLQSDGKIILTGTSDWFSNNANFCMQRFNINGSLDTTFGTQGIIITDFNSHSDVCNAALMQSDAKIVLAGLSYFNGPKSDFALARYNNDNTDIKEISENTFFTIFPNPSNGNFTFSSSFDNVKIAIYNTLGGKIYETNLKQRTSNEINLSQVPKGIYFVKVYDGEKIHTEKIVIR